MLVLGIESSCDDTAIAIIRDNVVLAEKNSSQIAIHKPFGGVVPELAARNHVEIIDQLIIAALEEANLEISQIELIAATGGPGLIGGVITSVMIAKGISLRNNIPLIFVNHLEGHALVPRFSENNLHFPFLLFLASGGHCQILEALDVGEYIKYGETLDDAIGESFDKVAKILGLEYPGGPYIEKAAKFGNPHKYKLPISMYKRDNCDFSLSGLKTACRNLVDQLAPLNKEKINDIAASFQYVVTLQIIDRIEFALQKFIKKHNLTENYILFSGGVAANQYIRKELTQMLIKYNFKLICPPTKLCTDNAVMIAWAGLENYKKGKISDLTFKPRSRWNLF
jgi:N6-L-threonylcarbamoyladenine synthase